MILIKSFLTGVLYDSFRLIYTYVNEVDKVRECYSCLEIMMQARLHVVFFFTVFIIKRASFKRFYLHMKPCNQAQFLNKKIIMKCLEIKIFA